MKITVMGTGAGRRLPIQRILAAHCRLLGNALLLAPPLAKLAVRYPDSERILLARPTFAALFLGKLNGIGAGMRGISLVLLESAVRTRLNGVVPSLTRNENSCPLAVRAS